MTDSKRTLGVPTPKRAVQRAARKITDLGDVFKTRDKPLGGKPDERKSPTGRATKRSAKYGHGFEKPWRSRMQRRTKRSRTGGWR